MKAVQFGAFGRPPEHVRCVDLPEPSPPGAGEVTLRLVAAPIHPADLLTIAGAYGVRPRLPAIPGFEGVGRVAATGSDVTEVRTGDLVLWPLGRPSWCEAATVRAAGLVALPAGADPLQCAMAIANPATAHAMLRGFVTPEPGDWLIQNAANSSVGRHIVGMARAAGWRTLNVVRRPEALVALSEIGADVTLMDAPDLAQQVRLTVGNMPVRLAIDAIGGAATGRLADCLSDGGTIVNYGLLSGEPCQVPAQAVVFRDITLRGFWLAQWPARVGAEAWKDMLRTVVDHVVREAVPVPVEATYPLEQAAAAVAHAMQEGRSGKILFVGGA